MTKEELFRACEDKIECLKQQMDEMPSDYLFYTDFINKYKLKTLTDFLEIPYIDFVIAALYPSFEELGDFNKTSEEIRSFAKVFEELNYNELSIITGVFGGIISSGKNDLFKEFFFFGDKRSQIRNVQKFFTSQSVKATNGDLPDTIQIFENLVEKNGNSGWNIKRFIEYYQLKYYAMHNLLMYITSLKYFKGRLFGFNINSDRVKREIDVQTILKVGETICECRRLQHNNIKIRNKNLQGEINNYNKFLREAKVAFEQDEIRNYENIVSNIDDVTIKSGFLDLVYQHNKVKYDNIDSEYEKLTKNSVISYLDILKNNGIRKSEIDLSKVIRNSCEDLDKMLKILKGIVGDKEIIIKIIETSDLVNVNYFKELKTRRVLSTEAFLKYPEIFDVNSEYRKMLDKNIEIMNSFKIDSECFSKHPNILIENDKLDDCFEILKSYGLLYSLKGAAKYDFLNCEDLCTVIDMVIELGYEQLLVEDIGLLNENNWDRIYVLKAMGLKPATKKELLKCLRDDKFFIPSNRLSLYIEDVSNCYDSLNVSYDANVESIVNDNSISERALSFDGVIISKNRVARNIETNEFDVNDLFRAIIKNSILSMNEIETIKSVLKRKIYKLDK